MLLSDVVMPGMSGTELAKILGDERAGIKVILMSGDAKEIASPNRSSRRSRKLPPETVYARIVDRQGAVASGEALRARQDRLRDATHQ